MESNTRSGRQSARSRSPAVLSVSDAISWIAFRELRPPPELPRVIDFTLRWECSSPDQTLAALEARASDTPFCIWEPSSLDEEPWNERSFKHVAWSPRGPKMLRWILRQLSSTSGRIVSFGEAVTTLREELEEARRWDARTDQGLEDLVHSLRLRAIEIWAKRDLPRGQENPAAQYEAVDSSLFLDESIVVRKGGTIEPGSDTLGAIFDYRGPTFRDARLYTKDVLRLWPAQRQGFLPDPQVTVQLGSGAGSSAGAGSSSDDSIDLLRIEPPPNTLPWVVARIMARLAYPPDRAWNLLHRAICAGDVTPRRGKLSAPGDGPKLEQWERDNLHFDFRRYQSDARSGAPVGSLRILGQSFHPHEITIPSEETEHWLASQASSPGVDSPRELSLAPTEAQAAPDGFIYIDAAVDAAQQRLGWSEGRVTATLLDAFVSGRIATRIKNPDGHEHFDREKWRGARLNVESFRRHQHGGAVVLGGEYHLHRFPVHGADFDGWLRSEVGGSEMQGEQTKPGKHNLPGTAGRIADALSSDGTAALTPAATRGATTINAQTRWRRWLETQMRASPKRPRSKKAMRGEGTAEGLPPVSDRSFNVAWGMAATASRAARWREGGRRPSTCATAEIPRNS
jgi:hypothetical protein